MLENELPVVFVEDEDLTKFDWRKVDKEIDTDDDDDAPASKNLIALLGFDPDKEDWSEYTADAQIHAPKGGVTVKGKFFSGGQFIPNEGGYAAEYNKMKKEEKFIESEKSLEGSRTEIERKSNNRRIVAVEKIKEVQKQFKIRTPEQNKDDVVNKLSKKTGLEYSVINEHVKFWAETSADNNPQSLGLQLVAKDIFKVGKTSHLNKSEAQKTKTQEKFIKTIYNETQQWFKEQGFDPDDEIILYRGVEDKIVSGKYALQPLSSFSFSKQIAKGFAGEGEDGGTTFIAKIPVKNIFSTPLTGVGCTNEYEAVVVGDVVDITVVNNVMINKNNDFKKVGEFDDVIIFPDLKSLEGAPKIVSGSFSCSYNNNLASLEGAPEIVGEIFNCRNCPNLTSLEGAPREVGGDFSCYHNPNLKSLEGAPKKVGGDFNCSYNKSLTSLEGAPKEVGGNFYCSENENFKSLEGAPKEVGGSFSCSHNENLKSLEGAPKKVGGNFYCTYNDGLKSLEGAPKEVDGNFNCSHNKNLKSLEGAPKEVGGDFYCDSKFTEEDVRKVCNVKGRIIRY